ncbi:conserved Plasmodium protein, unknown function [Plasmodium relictum]|uniref:Uncharacterized protein n=1 Tax=Plasmodium relictum TaxID=85471 RepID=A0A1J1HGD9_PLARL|nr:conserved Plasmodium protein, unknown function [Plasmodium relictum]CRH02909.1 conserved Plasmodium protein, unknown function [Plasmodium relictum]
MCKEVELLDLIKKIKTKTDKITNDIEDFNFDLLEENNFSYNIYSVTELIRNSNIKEKELGKYIDVYNNFEHEISYYFNEETEKIIYSSIINNTDKPFTKPQNNIFYSSSNIINQKLNYEMLEYNKLRNYEYNVKFFKPLKLDIKENFSDSSKSSNKENKNKENNLKDITKIIKSYI